MFFELAVCTALLVGCGDGSEHHSAAESSTGESVEAQNETSSSASSTSASTEPSVDESVETQNEVPAPAPAPAPVGSSIPQAGSVIGMPAYAKAANFVPPYTARANKRYVSPNGSDSNDGMTRATAWKRMSAHIRDIPSDTEVIFLDGVHDFTNGDAVYNTGTNWPFSYPGTSSRPILADRVTIRSESYRNATLLGSRSASTGYYAFNVSYARDLEIWGFTIRNWRFQKGAALNFWGDIDGLRWIGMKGENNGVTLFDHWIYGSGGWDNEVHVPRNIDVLYNDVNMPQGSGSFFHIFTGARLAIGDPAAHNAGPRDVEVAFNKVRGPGYYAIILDSNGTRDLRLHHNDIRMPAAFELFEMQSHGYGDALGPDVIFENNIFEQQATDKPLTYIGYPRNGSGPHNLTTRNNIYWHRGSTSPSVLYKGAPYTLGGTDSLQPPPNY